MNSDPAHKSKTPETRTRAAGTVLAVCMLAGVVSIPGTAVAFDVNGIGADVVDVSVHSLEKSNLLRITLDITNNGDEEATFFSANFGLLDSQLREYGATSGFDVRERGEDVPRDVCNTIFGDDVNPGLSMELEVCFEVPKEGFEYDSVLIYENIILQSANKAVVVPLVENSVGYNTIVNRVDPQDQELTDRADELGDGGGCLIATAAYGTELAPEVQNLREIRGKMYETEAGGETMRMINHLYYSFSPTVADWERENAVFKEAVRVLITPAMLSFTVLDHEEMDSEEDLIAYVAGIVVLNAGMYFVAPVAAIIITNRSIRR